jgi:hypothetical protein
MYFEMVYDNYFSNNAEYWLDEFSNCHRSKNSSLTTCSRITSAETEFPV